MEEYLSPFSFAYRINSGVDAATKHILTLCEQNNLFAIHLDIHQFFDTIDLELLLRKLSALPLPPALMALITAFLNVTIQDEGRQYVAQCGILQGSPLSPLLSNLYMNDFDHWMTAQKVDFVRYADDLFTQQQTSAEYWPARIEERLWQQEHLALAKEKTAILPIDEMVFLGCHLEKRGERWHIKKVSKQNSPFWDHWHASSMTPPEGQAYLLQAGILRRKDFSILFENDETRLLLPPLSVDVIHLYDEVALSPGFLRFAAHSRIRLCFYIKHREYLGDFVPAHMQCSPEFTLAQASAYMDTQHRLKIAQLFLHAAMHNMLSTVRYYRERKNEALKSVIDTLEQLEKEAALCGTVDALLLCEARFRVVYYSAFSCITNNPAFCFTKRSRRPPRDPINALISFGNSVVYQRAATEVYKAGLDIRISFLHSAQRYRDNLSLDLAEIYKPLWVDRTIFSLVNKQMVDGKRHFFHDSDAVFLNQSGKTLFLKEMRKRISQRINLDGQAYLNAALMRRDLLGLKKHLLTGNDIQFYHYR